MANRAILTDSGRCTEKVEWHKANVLTWSRIKLSGSLMAVRTWHPSKESASTKLGASPLLCSAVDGACTNPSDCCNDLRCGQGGICQHHCGQSESPCDNDMDCCTGRCTSGTCRSPHDVCSATGESCSSSSNCCAGQCTSNVCTLPVADDSDTSLLNVTPITASVTGSCGVELGADCSVSQCCGAQLACNGSTCDAVCGAEERSKCDVSQCCSDGRQCVDVECRLCTADKLGDCSETQCRHAAGVPRKKTDARGVLFFVDNSCLWCRHAAGRKRYPSAN
jgi:hypothetical protein